MKVVLEVIKGSDTGKRFEFTKPDVFLVGRSKDAHFRLSDDDPYVSRNHFLLEICPPKCILNDLQSTNPPSVNGVVKLEEELFDRDIIEVGYTQIKVLISWKVETNVIHCQRCSKEVSILKDEIPLSYCSVCQRQIEIEERKATEKKVHRILCRCGKDLTEFANSDGQAEKLQGIVTYSCPKCLEIGEEAGKKIDDYETIRFLGKGGMGKVYLAYHKPTARIVALKQMLNLSSIELVHRFEREIRLMRELSHKNTINYIDSGVSDKKPYLVLEFARGGDLNDILKRNKSPLPEPEAVKYIIDALYGFEFIHTQKIIHRDLKPENILLQKTEDGRLTPKITDFGLAKRYTEAGGTKLIKIGVGMGTLLYMAPEQIKDTRSVKEPADLYSMGVTLYYLLTGKFPYHFPTELEIMLFILKEGEKCRNPQEALKQIMEAEKMKQPHLIILTEEPIPIRKRKPDISSRLAGIVDKAIKKDISERFQSAVEFRKALEKR